MSGLLLPIKGKVLQGFGRPALKVEPTMWLQVDAGGDRRCRPTAFAAGTKYEDVHPGTDTACPVGTAIVAPERGVLLRRETYRIFNPFSGRYVYGHSIYFGFGGAIYYVDHLGRPFDPRGTGGYIAKEGQHCAKGQLIARTGDSGIVTGPHAHQEVRQSDDPHESWGAYRFNLERLLVGGDLAHLDFIKP